MITAMYYVFSKLSLKGMKLIFEVGQQKTDAIPLLLIPLVMIGTWLTHLSEEVLAEKELQFRSEQPCLMHSEEN